MAIVLVVANVMWVISYKFKLHQINCHKVRLFMNVWVCYLVIGRNKEKVTHITLNKAQFLMINGRI